MGTTNYGTQTLSFDFKAEGKSENFNKINYQLFPTGIYSGGLLSKSASNQVDVSALTCYIGDSTNEVGVRIQTASAVTKNVAPGTPYIVLRFSWSNVENNYMDILTVAYDDLASDDLIVGRCVYIGGVLQSDFDYTKRSNPILNNLKSDNEAFKVIPKEPYSDTVYVYGGTLNSTKGQITVTDQDSPTISSTTLGRIDLVYIDPIDGEVKVEEGTDAASPVAPLYGNKIVLAEIERGASSTYVTGAAITNVFNDQKEVADHPWFPLLNEDDYLGNTLEYTGDGILFDLTTPNPTDSEGNSPNDVNFSWTNPSDSNIKFTNRGVYLIGASGYLTYDYTWANEMRIAGRIKPDFTYNDGNEHFVFDSREGDSSSDDDIWFYYDGAASKWTCIIQDNSSDYLELISSSAVASNTGFNDTWHDFVIVFSKAGNTGKLYIDGVAQTTNTNVNGITAIDLSGNTQLTLGCNYYATLGSDGFDGYITDFLFEKSYSDSTTNYDGTANVKPYYIPNKKVMGYKTKWDYDIEGNLSGKNAYFESLNVAGQSYAASSKGLESVTLTNHDNGSLPAIAVGSWLEVNGTIFTSFSQYSILGSASSGLNYIKFVVSGSSCTPTWTTTPPTWSDAKQGWYSGNDRYLFTCYYDGTNYLDKQKLRPEQFPPEFIKPFFIASQAEDYEMDGTTIEQRILYAKNVRVTADTTVKCHAIICEGVFDNSDGHTITVQPLFQRDHASSDARIEETSWQMYHYLAGGQLEDGTSTIPARSYGCLGGSSSGRSGTGVNEGASGAGSIAKRGGNTPAVAGGGPCYPSLGIGGQGGDTTLAVYLTAGGAGPGGGGGGSTFNGTEYEPGKGGGFLSIICRGDFVNNGSIIATGEGEDLGGTGAGAGGGGMVILLAFGNTCVLGTIDCSGGSLPASALGGGGGGGHIHVAAKTSDFSGLDVSGGLGRRSPAHHGGTGTTEEINLNTTPYGYYGADKTYSQWLSKFISMEVLL